MYLINQTFTLLMEQIPSLKVTISIIIWATFESKCHELKLCDEED
jgi:hypothetical protein